MEAPNEALVGNDPFANAQLIRAVFSGKPGPARDVVLLNAGAAITASGRVKTIQEGIKLAATVLDAGLAQVKLDRLIQATQTLKPTQKNLA